MSRSWLAEVQVPPDVTGTIAIIISLCSGVKANGTVLAVFPHRVHLFCSSASPWFLSGDFVLSGDVNGKENVGGLAGAGWGGVGWVGGGIKAACPAVDQGRNPASGWLSQDYHGQRQRIHPEGWMIISGWGHCRHCGFYFWLCASNFIINVLQWTKRKGEQSGVVVRLDLRCGGISPVWTFVSITWSACQWHKWRSQSLFIITLTFKIKNRSQHVAVLNAWWCCCTTDLQGWQLQTNSAGFFGFVCFKANETHLLFLLPVCVLINTTSHPRGKEKVWVWL